MTLALAGRAALVTGASRGIGAAIARELARAGARVALVARTGSALEALAAELGAGAFAIAADLGTSGGAATAARHFREIAGDAPDVLVNNAGMFVLQTLDTMPPGTFTATIETNLVAPFRLVREFLPRMLERGSGQVVTIGSIADRTVFPENGAYSAAKFGLRALHEVLRAETRGTGVRATLISPGPVDTPLWDDVTAAATEHRRPLPGPGDMLAPTSVAAAVLYAVTQPSDANVDELRLSRA